MNGYLTDAELAVIELLSQATQRFSALPEHHPADRDEWAATVHTLQRQVMARAARRAHPDVFTSMVRS